MNLPSDLQRLAPFIAVAILAVAGLALVVRGMGGGGEGSSAQQVVDRAFGGEGTPRSGKLSATATASLVGALSGQAGLKAAGAFDRGAGQVPPKFDLDLGTTGTLGGTGETSVRVLSDGKKGFLRLDGRWYELPASEFERVGGATSAGQSPLSALGIDPGSWLQNPTPEGTAQVEGVATDHVSAGVDTAKMAADLRGLAERTGQAERLPPQARSTFQDAVKEAKVDLFVGQADGVLRKMTVTAQLDANPSAGTPPLRGQVRFEVTLSEVNRPQQIEAPRNATPVKDLGAVPGLGSFGSLPSSSGAKTPSKPPPSKPAPPRPGSKNGGGKSAKDSEQAYVACVVQAADPAALEKCQVLVP